MSRRVPPDGELTRALVDGRREQTVDADEREEHGNSGERGELFLADVRGAALLQSSCSESMCTSDSATFGIEAPPQSIAKKHLNIRPCRSHVNPGVCSKGLRQAAGDERLRRFRDAVAVPGPPDDADDAPRCRFRRSSSSASQWRHRVGERQTFR